MNSSTSGKQAPTNRPCSGSMKIAIAGGGLLGRLLAWRLLSAGFNVSLFEAGSFSQPLAAAHTAAGMIAPLSEAAAAGEASVYQLGLHSLDIWPRWLQELQAQSGEQVDYQEAGSLVIAHPQDQAELTQLERDLQQVLPASAIDSEQHPTYDTLDAAGIAQHEASLGGCFRSGLLLPREAHINNRKLLPLLYQQIVALGGHCYENSPVAIEGKRLMCQNSHQQHDFDLVLDCRGTGAKTDLKGLRGVRGEVLSVQTTEVSLARPVRLMHPRYQLYIVPKLNNCFVIGATQIESEDRSPMSLQSSLELSSALYSINPAFAEARIVEMNTNLRPAMADNHPHIELGDDCIRINGLFRHGYLLAPPIVESVMNHILTMTSAQTTASSNLQSIEQLLAPFTHMNASGTQAFSKELQHG